MFVPVTQPKSQSESKWQACVHGIGLAVLLLLLVHPSWAADLASTTAQLDTGEAWSASPAPPIADSAAQAPTSDATTTVNATGTVSARPASPDVRSISSQPAPQPTTDETADADPAALTMFRPHLDPYGSWVDDARYGRVWVPNRGVVGQNFSPYVTNGRWALDGDDNWVWESGYPFGWVVFHYGRWFYSPELGWGWVPGRTYAPSWVVWRLPTAQYAYVGWAPMPPRYGWFSGGAVWYSSYGAVSYVFCPSDYLFYPGVGLYVVHDPFLVSRLGLYTTFYYSPYYYGHYHGGYHHGYQHGPAGYRPPAYGPPVHRTRISPRAIPRERVAADPRSIALAPRGSVVGRGSVGAVPGGRIRSSTSLGATRPSAMRERSFSSAPSRDPQFRSREGFSRPSHRSEAAPMTRSPSARMAPPARTPSYRPPAVRSQPSFRAPSVSTPHRSPTFRAPSVSTPHRSPSFRSPSFSTPHRAPSSGGFRHRR